MKSRITVFDGHCSNFIFMPDEVPPGAARDIFLQWPIPRKTIPIVRWRTDSWIQPVKNKPQDYK